MEMEEVLEIMYEKSKGSIKPIDCVETDKVFSFFLVTSNGSLIGNNSRYVVTKDGKFANWVASNERLPEEYLSDDDDPITKWTDRQLGSIWTRIIQEHKFDEIESE